MRILLFGHKGQLGSGLLNTLKSTHEVMGLDIDDIDISNKKAVDQACRKTKPHCILNAAAYTQVESAETDALRSFEVNALGAYHVAQAAQEVEATLVQISTDYVFGNTRSWYVETDTPYPLNVYGASKLAGEQLVKIACSSLYIVRTSALFGKQRNEKHPNFVKRMLTLAREKREIRVVNDQFATPTYVVDLAKAIYNLLERRPPFGIYHITNKGSCSWYEFARYVLDVAGVESEVQPIKSSQSGSNIDRPRSSILRTKYDIILPTWEDAVKRYLHEIEY